MMKKTIFLSIILLASLSFNALAQALNPAATVYLTTADFQKKVFDYTQSADWKYQGDKPCIIDFYATWCGPCKRLAPILEEIAKEYGDRVIVYKVDAEKEKELAAIFQVTSYPRLVFIPMDGKPQVAVGFQPKANLEIYMSNIFGIKK